LERTLNYPKSRPAGGGFASLAGAMFGQFHGWFHEPDILVMAE
jgi:hypothetical protein